MSKLKKYTEEEIEDFFADNGIEFDDLFDFLLKAKEGGKMSLNFDSPNLIIKLELHDL